MLVAVAQEGRALVHASASLRADPAVVLAAVSRTGEALRHASTALRGRRLIVLTAVAQDVAAMQFASVSFLCGKCTGEGEGAGMDKEQGKAQRAVFVIIVRCCMLVVQDPYHSPS